MSKADSQGLCLLTITSAGLRTNLNKPIGPELKTLLNEAIVLADEAVMRWEGGNKSTKQVLQWVTQWQDTLEYDQWAPEIGILLAISSQALTDLQNKLHTTWKLDSVNQVVQAMEHIESWFGHKAPQYDDLKAAENALAGLYTIMGFQE